jgi:hypothetical protein
VRARQVHLPAALAVGRFARVEVRSRGPGDARRDRHPFRLARDVGGDREQFLRLVLEGLSALVIHTAGVDAAFEVEDLPARADLGIARCDATHARLRVLVATRARLLRLSRGLAPQFLAALHPQQAGVGEVVVLQRAEIGAEKGAPRFQI